MCQFALYADIGNDDVIFVPCGRLPGVTSRALIAGVESAPQGSILCHLKFEIFGVGRDRTRFPRFATRHSDTRPRDPMYFELIKIVGGIVLATSYFYLPSPLGKEGIVFLGG